MNENNLLSINLSATSESLILGMAMNWPIAIGGLLAIIAIWLFQHFFWRSGPKAQLKEVTVSIGGQELKYEIERNSLNLEIAHRIYIELITRKAALPFDENNDIISEIYDSWYQLFKTTREEIKAINGDSLLEKKSSDKLISMATKVLNDGLRPHLTKYQGRYRRWYTSQLDKPENLDRSPQQIQSAYPELEELINSIKNVNQLLSQYAEELREFIYLDK